LTKNSLKDLDTLFHLGLVDHERRGKTDDVTVSGFAKQALVLEGQTDVPSVAFVVGIDFDRV
jgi:hypothetical protein